MKLYLDACYLNRPFDDQSQQRVRVETEAIGIVVDLCARGPHRWHINDALEDEVSRYPYQEQRAKVLDEYHRAFAVRLRRMVRSRGMVPPRAARRLALSRAIKASSPAQTKAVFSRIPVRPCRFRNERVVDVQSRSQYALGIVHK